MLQLDFKLITVDERTAYVNKFFLENEGYVPSKHELTTITNYILFGKDPFINKHGQYDPELPVEKWTNMCNRKEIEIPTKYTTWAKKQPASLEETLESPVFNEAELLQPRIQGKTIRPVFDRDEESDIPTIGGLWETIDHYNEKLKDPELTSAQHYQYTHMIVELRREQFTLRDIFKPIRTHRARNHTHFIPMPSDLEIDWDGSNSKYGCAPMGVYYEGDLRFDDPLTLADTKDDWGYSEDSPHIIDFCDPHQIDVLVHHYYDIVDRCTYEPFAAQCAIVRTLDYYIGKTDLTEIQREIVNYKKLHWPNKLIVEEINQKYQKSYNPNYISTIYQKSCARIAKTAERIFNYYKERINPASFKKCAVCGEMKLRNSDEFMRKARNSDGFSSKCKECEKKK